jgi:hypothetical protein
MIERHTIKFGPAVSQKELGKALHEHGGLHPHSSSCYSERTVKNRFCYAALPVLSDPKKHDQQA